MVGRDKSRCSLLKHCLQCSTNAWPLGPFRKTLCVRTLRKGRVAEAHVNDNATMAIRDFNAQLLRDERVSLAFVPIGDGMALCTKRGM